MLMIIEKVFNFITPLIAIRLFFIIFLLYTWKRAGLFNLEIDETTQLKHEHIIEFINIIILMVNFVFMGIASSIMPPIS